MLKNGLVQTNRPQTEKNPVQNPHSNFREQFANPTNKLNETLISGKTRASLNLTKIRKPSTATLEPAGGEKRGGLEPFSHRGISAQRSTVITS